MYTYIILHIIHIGYIIMNKLNRHHIHNLILDFCELYCAMYSYTTVHCITVHCITITYFKTVLTNIYIINIKIFWFDTCICEVQQYSNFTQ